MKLAQTLALAGTITGIGICFGGSAYYATQAHHTPKPAALEQLERARNIEERESILSNIVNSHDIQEYHGKVNFYEGNAFLGSLFGSSTLALFCAGYLKRKENDE